MQLNSFGVSRRALAVSLVSCLSASALLVARSTSVPDVSVTEYASGLNDPRGLAFGPDGNLYVAEAGSGGASQSTVGLCDQVEAIGPYKGGATARIVSVTPSGHVSVVAANLPSTEAIPEVGGDKGGVSSLAFIGNRLHALISGAGCSHGHLDANNGILALDRSGTREVADLSAWLLANPGAKGAEVPRSPDYEPDGTWYSMVFERGRLYAIEPNHGLLVSVHPKQGRVTLIKDLFATFGDHTYTTLTSNRGALYVGTLGRIVFTPTGIDLDASFDAGIYKLSSNGDAAQVATGLKAVLGVAFDGRHRMYALQSPIFVPGTGSLVRVDPDGSIIPIVTDLVFPSAIVRGPDGAFYVSECGYHCAPGDGRILRIDLR